MTSRTLLLLALTATAVPAAPPPPVRRPAPPRSPATPAVPAPTIHVGDRVRLNMPMTDHTTFTGADCRNKVTLLFFWMSTDHSAAAAQQLAALRAKYADNGLQVIGINGDRELDAMQASVAKYALDFPQSWTGYWRENKAARDLGVPMVPYAAVIGPDATLLYTGPVARAESEVEKAFVNHAPAAAAPDDLAQARTLLTQSRTSLDTGDVLAAFRAFAAVPPGALKDPLLSRTAGDLRSRLLHSTDAAFPAVDALIQQHKNVDAALSLKAITQTLGTMTGSAEAQKRLDDLLSHPDVKLEVQRFERTAAAAQALAAARALRDAGNDEAAYHRFKAVAMDYADTPSAPDAAAAVKAYDADPAFGRQLRETAAAPKATAALRLADSYRASNHPDQARRKYQEVLDAYPDTRFADAAKKALDELR